MFHDWKGLCSAQNTTLAALPSPQNYLLEDLEATQRKCKNTKVQHDVTKLYQVIKGKGFPYSLPSVGPGTDPGVQAVSPQVTISHPTGGRLPLLSARPAVTFPAAEHLPPLGWYQVILLGDRGT